MGFFLRKSIKPGPFQINLSKSGIGLSGGIKGARISTGPISYENYTLPSIELLNEAPARTPLDDDELLGIATRLAEQLREFNITGQIKYISPGPIFTTYQFQPGAGVKYSRFTALADDQCLATKSVSIDIERVPGTALIGIRVPNPQRETISQWIC